MDKMFEYFLKSNLLEICLPETKKRRYSLNELRMPYVNFLDFLDIAVLEGFDINRIVGIASRVVNDAIDEKEAEKDV